MVSLNRRPATTDMHNTDRRWARPPQMRLRPCDLPLSLLKGATPTRAAICLRFRLPSSGSSAMRLLMRTGPTPGTEFSSLALALQSGCFAISLFNCSSILSRRFRRNRIVASTSLRAHPCIDICRFCSATIISTNCRCRVTRWPISSNC